MEENERKIQEFIYEKERTTLTFICPTFENKTTPTDTLAFESSI